MAQKQILDFKRTLRILITNSCAICVAFYIERLDLKSPLSLLQLITQKKFLKFFYAYLKNMPLKDKRFKSALLQKRAIKNMIQTLHEGVILRNVLRVQRERNL